MSNATFIGYSTILRKETVRIFRIWKQTILPSVVSQALYFAIFGGIIGSRIGEMNGMSYGAFLVPGLVMMAAITNAFSNVASSFFGAKFQRSIEEILVSPLKPWAMLAGYVSGGIIRGATVAAAIFATSVFFVAPHIEHIFTLLFFLFMTCIIFSLLGFFNALFAKSLTTSASFPLSFLRHSRILAACFIN